MKPLTYHSSRRRFFIRAARSAGVTLALSEGLLGRAEAGKARKADVYYQDTPKEGKTCSACALFIAGSPPACGLVEGEIQPSGWCIAFSAKR